MSSPLILIFIFILTIFINLPLASRSENSNLDTRTRGSDSIDEVVRPVENPNIVIETNLQEDLDHKNAEQQKQAQGLASDATDYGYNGSVVSVLHRSVQSLSSRNSDHNGNSNQEEVRFF